MNAIGVIRVLPAFRPKTTRAANTLDPFSVTSDSNTYHATNFSGTRVNTRIMDIPVPISVVTEQLIEDFLRESWLFRYQFNENFTIRKETLQVSRIRR